MNDSNGSQPAYPTNEMHGSAGEYAMQAVGGLTKREAFAMAAMQGLCTGRDFLCHERAAYAVEHADALLAELAKEQP